MLSAMSQAAVKPVCYGSGLHVCKNYSAMGNWNNTFKLLRSRKCFSLAEQCHAKSDIY